eukprot:6213343-Pleurochrysis_carterae.AAC.3
MTTRVSAVSTTVSHNARSRARERGGPGDVGGLAALTPFPVGTCTGVTVTPFGAPSLAPSAVFGV